MAIEIPLPKGLKVVVDDIDADLAQFRWSTLTNPRGVVYARRESKTTMHRVILERLIGRPIASHEVADHKNGNTLDNRRENLRVATRSQNQANRRVTPKESGYKGVGRNGKRWSARIRVNGNLLNLGTFDTPREAHEAYKEAAIKYHGDFAHFSEVERDVIGGYELLKYNAYEDLIGVLDSSLPVLANETPRAKHNAREIIAYLKIQRERIDRIIIEAEYQLGLEGTK